MENCNHKAVVKTENGMIVTYCQKCGKILDSKTIGNNNASFYETTAPKNDGQILHGNITAPQNGGEILHG